MRYLGDDSDINLTSEYEHELPEFIRWRWADIRELPSLIVEFKRPVYEEVVKAFLPIIDQVKRSTC